MKFEEALKAMRDGKKVKKCDGEYCYYIKNNVLYHENSEGEESLDDRNCNIVVGALFCDDWVFAENSGAIEENKADKINMELKDTIEMMTSNDYKERFKAEYHQLRIRLEKLYEMLVRYDAGTLGFTPDCSIALLKDQLGIMRDYLYALQVRAEIEGIEL